MDDKQIIDLYWVRSERAIAETDRKYGKFCHRIAFHILANPQDSEECVSDTFLKAWSAIPPKRPVKLSTFLGKITRNLALNRYEKHTAQKRGGGEVPVALDELAECIPDPNSVERMVDNRILADKLNIFLESLPAEARKIFMRRYWEVCSVQEIAEIYGISESKVKVSLFRTRGKLRAFLEQEGITL
ncbi:MAG: RNA polymerase sigma factor [Oscillospiraceae bacterium]|nr:RNA polymerase sigma factor [Oscillospiraceae bacterium]